MTTVEKLTLGKFNKKEHGSYDPPPLDQSQKAGRGGRVIGPAGPQPTLPTYVEGAGLASLTRDWPHGLQEPSPKGSIGEGASTFLFQSTLLVRFVLI